MFELIKNKKAQLGGINTVINKVVGILVLASLLTIVVPLLLAGLLNLSSLGGLWVLFGASGVIGVIIAAVFVVRIIKDVMGMGGKK